MARRHAHDGLTRQARRTRPVLLRAVLSIVLTLAMMQSALADIYNSATASGTYNAATVNSNSSNVSVPVVAANPSLQLTKGGTFNDSNGDGAAQVGETITYNFTIKNTGNVTISNITISDPNATVSGGPLASLDPGVTNTTTFTAVHTLTQSDLTAGKVTNSATVQGTAPSGSSVSDVSDSSNAADDTGSDNDQTTTTLTASAIVANADNFVSTPINGYIGGTTSSVFSNDTLNGSSFTSSQVIASITSNGGISGLTIASDGTLSIPAGTAAGSYTVSYQICEALNTTNCSTTTVSLSVTAAAIAAVNDSASGVNGLTGSSNVVNAFSNDTLNGAAVNSSQITATVVGSLPSQLTFDTATGVVGVNANTPAGTYSFNYQICENLNPTNCSTATVSITTVAAPIVAVADTITPAIIGASGGTTTTSVLANDTLNGSPVAAADVTTTLTNNGGLTGATINSNGMITVPAGTPAGTYSLTYQICENLNPTNCSSTTAQITVSAAPIVAVDDTIATPINGAAGGTTVSSVLSNDTLNSAPVAAGDVNITLTNDAGLSGATINSDGTITIPAGTVAGTYTFTYQICEKLNPTNCSSATAQVTVNPGTLVAEDDNFSSSPVNGMSGGATATVYSNDTLNGTTVSSSTVTPSISNAGGLTGVSINPDGTIQVPANTPAGNYSVTYQICENLNPTNCKTAVVQITVSAAAIVAVNDDFSSTPIANGTGGTTSSVLNNDTLNGAAVVSSDVNITLTNDGGISGATIAADGTITVPAGVVAGNYTLTYQICEKLNPSNCSSASVVVTVAAGVLVAGNDDLSSSPVNGMTGGTTSSVYSNDTLNGAPVTSSTVTPSISDDGGLTGVTINSDGTIQVPADTPAGTYTVTYQICENLNPTNCKTATADVTVTAAPISAVADVLSPGVNGSSGGTTTTSVLANDTLNGAPVVATDVTTTLTNNGGLTGATIDSDGMITVPAGTPAGTYTLTYQICENLNPTNCSSTTVQVTVDAGVLVATDDDFSSSPVAVNSNTTGTTSSSVFANDTLNGVTVTSSTVTVSVVSGGTLPGAGITNDGQITVPAGTASGTYTVDYQICEKLNPTNCKTATATLVVANSDAQVSGTVYFDKDGNGDYNSGDVAVGAGYTVEIYDSSRQLIATTTTDSNGAYSLTVPPGNDYRLVFKDPEGVVIGTTPNIDLGPGESDTDQNQPIDPSGIVYDSVTHKPVSDATLTITDKNGVPLPTICLVSPAQQNQVTDSDGGYRFDIVAGAAAACPSAQTEYRIEVKSPIAYEPPFAFPPQPGALNAATCAGGTVAGTMCQVSTAASPEDESGDIPYYIAFLLGDGDMAVIHNYLPLKPKANGAANFIKRALIKEAKRGEAIPYVIEATDLSFSPVRIVDIMPKGFDFDKGSARVNGAKIKPTVDDRTLTFDNLTPDSNGNIKIELTLIAMVTLSSGDYVNRAELINPATGEVVATARATVRIVVEHVFDCGDIIGKVFDDKNRDGYPSDGEPGLPGVRLTTVKGVIITTDKNGLFHIACADLPDADIGSNFILKLDARTLPTGYQVTTENPRVVRLTAGKMTKLNFGAAGIRIVKMTMMNELFIDGTTELTTLGQESLSKLMAVLDQEPSVLQLTYKARSKANPLSSQRLSAVENQIKQLWKEKSRDYKLSIEGRVISIGEVRQ